MVELDVSFQFFPDWIAHHLWIDIIFENRLNLQLRLLLRVPENIRSEDQRP